jgi:hypothetical protein
MRGNPEPMRKLLNELITNSQRLFAAAGEGIRQQKSASTSR